MSYFALRAAPLGAAPPEVITALFYGFAPGLVARAVPDTWKVAPPERYLAVRLAAVDAALHRVLGAETLASDAVVEAAELAREAAVAAPTAGRALGAANAALPWPDVPHLVLWHAQTVLREQRGDGHVAALLTAGLDPVEAGLLLRRGHRDGPGLDAHPPRLDRAGVGRRRGAGWSTAACSRRRRGAHAGGPGAARRGRAAHGRAGGRAWARRSATSGPTVWPSW